MSKNCELSLFPPTPPEYAPTDEAKEAAKRSMSIARSGKRWSALAPVVVGVHSTT